MIGLEHNAGNLLHRFASDRRGAMAAIFVLSSVATVGTAAFVVDAGRLFVAHRTLQAATDAAALAGAAQINDGTAIATAKTYSAAPGSKNAAATGLSVNLAAGYPILKCVAATGVPCSNPSNANAIVVRQDATVPMLFAGILGIKTMDISASATAAMNAGQTKPLDVMIVLDTTGSMNTVDTFCSIKGATRLTCAKAGANTLLKTLSPSVNNVGLMVFPPVANKAEGAKNYDCKTTAVKVATYHGAPMYQILGLSNDYRASDTADGLNGKSDLARAFGGGDAGCRQGASATGGVGTYFADAIKAAQTALVNGGTPDAQKVMILLSDGDSTATPGKDDEIGDDDDDDDGKKKSGTIEKSKGSDQCKQATTAAATAAGSGTWVYSIAYGAPTNKNSSCQRDKLKVSACETMQSIASDPKKFYSSQTGGSLSCTSAAQPVTELVSVFTSIGKSFKGARLISDSMK